MKSMAERTAALAGLVLAIACAGITPAAAAESAEEEHRSSGSRSVRVAGQQIPVDVTNGLYDMRGSMIGSWQYIPTKVLHDVPTLYAEAGVEVFTGCIDRRPKDGRCTDRDYRGELHLAFLYWASFDLSGNLLKGQCVHPVTGGKGAFAGARGLLTMVDRPVGDEVRTTYRGYVALTAVPTEGDAETPSASSGGDPAVALAGSGTVAASGPRAC